MATLLCPVSRRTGLRALTHVPLLQIALAIAFPVLWAVVTSVKPTAVLYDLNPLAAAPATRHYRGALDALPVVRLVLNTAVMSLVVVLGQLTVATLAAYGLTRYRFRSKGLAFGLVR